MAKMSDSWVRIPAKVRRSICEQDTLKSTARGSHDKQNCLRHSPLTSVKKLKKFPVDWKHANVTSIFKKGDRELAENHRLISITSLVCKLMESIIKDHNTQHMMSNGIMTEKQYGLVEGRSCKTKLF
jgi:hypothetical protein